MPGAGRRALRVAILTPNLPPHARMGGIATAHFNLFRALAAAGWQVKAFAYQESADADSETEVRRAPPRAAVFWAAQACRLALALLSPFRRSYQLAETLSGALGARRIGEPLLRFRPDIIIAPDKGCPLALVRKPPGARVIWISHHNPLRFLGMAASPPLSALDARLALRVESRGLRKADLVICPSRDMREQFLKAYRFDGRVEVVPNVVSAEVEAAAVAAPGLRHILGLAADAPLFFLPGAGTGVKGGAYLAPLLAEIGRRHPEAGVYLSGQIENAYRAAPTGAPANVRIFSPGALPYRDHLSRVRECDVALSPALLESFGMSLLEAAWLGVPAAAFAVGGIPDLIGTTAAGSNGETVPVADVARLCDAGDALLRRLRSGELGRAQVAEYTRTRFSTARTIERLGALMHSLLEEAPQPGRAA